MPGYRGVIFFFCIKNMIKKTGEWKKHVEANSRLMKKFEESRAELEKVLRVAQEGLEEKGDPEELLRKHTVSLLCVHQPVCADTSSETVN